MNYLEILFASLFNSVFGNPIFLGLFFLLFMIFISMVMRLSLEGSLVFIIPSILLLTSVINIFEPLKILIMLGLAFIFAFMLIRIVRH